MRVQETDALENPLSNEEQGGNRRTAAKSLFDPVAEFAAPRIGARIKGLRAQEEDEVVEASTEMKFARE